MRDRVLMMMRRIVEESSTMRIFTGASWKGCRTGSVGGWRRIGFQELHEGFEVIRVDVLELNPQFIAPRVHLLDPDNHAQGDQRPALGVLHWAEMILVTA